MRLSDPIEKTGFFWLPNHPDDQYPGTLHISESGEVTLRIVYRPKSLNSQLLHGGTPIGKNPSRILGIVDNDPVALERCEVVEDPFHPLRIIQGHVSTSRFRIESAFIGASFVNDEPITFSKVDFSIEGLSKWFSISGFRTEMNSESGKANWSLHYTQPDDISVLLPDQIQLHFLFDPKFSLYDYKSSHISSKISQRMRISLVSDRLLPVKHFYTIMQRVQVFLCLIMNKAVSVEWVRGYSSDKLDQWNREITTNVYFETGLKEQNRGGFASMMHSYSDISDNFEDIIQNWIANYENMRPVFDLYLSSMAGAYVYLEGVFLALVQALETLHRRISSETQIEVQNFEELRTAILEVVPPGSRKFIESKLEYANEISLRKRLKLLINPFGELFGTSSEIRSFVGKIVDARNYLTHYDRKIEERAKGIIRDELDTIYRKLEALFQLHLLHLMGIDVDRVRSMALKNASLCYKLGLNDRQG